MVPNPRSTSSALPHPDLRTSLGAVPLSRDVVSVRGPEAIEYLQGQLSQDVEALPEGASAPSLLLQPAGKVDAWLRVTRTGPDEVLLDSEPGSGDAILSRLRRFLLRTKAEVALDTWSGFAVRGPGATDAASTAAEQERPGGRVFAADWPGVEGADILWPGAPGDITATGPAGVPLVAVEALEALRIECGVPAISAEVTERTIPAELGRWIIEASVSFDKGCYTGQELVARVDSRGGHGPRPIRGLLVAGEPPAVGSDVVSAGQQVGVVTSSASSTALGAVALSALPRSLEAGQEVTVAGPEGSSPATVADLPLR